MKKSYNRPQMEIFEVSSENIMQAVSVNGGGGGGEAHAPKHPGEEINL